MKQRYKILIVAGALFLVILPTLNISTAMTFDQNDYIFVFHLFLNKQGQLTANRDYQPTYDTDIGPFQQEVIPSGTKFYRGDIVDAQGRVVFQFQFDPKKGVASYVGPVEVRSPYYTTAKIVSFYDPNGQLAVSVDTTNTLSCVQDNICDQEIEDSESCPSDCKSPSVSVVPTPVPPIADDGLGLTTIILYIVGGLAVAGLTIWGIMKWKRKKVSNTPIIT